MTSSTDGAALPVTLLTGFLGSGKTTLLNTLLKRLPLTAVVMNEFGEVGLDHQLLEETRGPLALLAGGCVCCQVQGALAPTLKNLWLGRQDGKLPPFERVVIETTGIADPAPILEILLRDRYIAARYRMDGVVATVDAVLAQGQLDDHPEARRQVAVADRLLLTKTDLADAAEVDALRARLADLNPAARQTRVVDGDVQPEEVIGCGLFDAAVKHPDVRRWLAESRYAPAAPARHGLTRQAVSAAPSHANGIASFVVAFDAPVDWPGLAAGLEMLLSFRAKQLLRLKALVNARGEARPLVLHAVQHVLHAPAYLPEWPDDDRRSRFVFITEGLDAGFVAGLLEQFAYPERAGPAGEQALAHGYAARADGLPGA
jgi:G3E family GTPase